jgi:hypothetical protein
METLRTLNRVELAVDEVYAAVDGVMPPRCICGSWHSTIAERDACLAKPVEVRFKEMFGRALGISEKEQQVG